MGEHNRIMFFSHHYIRFSEKYICFSGEREALSHESLWVSPTSLRAVGFLTSKMFLHILRVRKKISGISPTYFSEHTQLIELRLFGELE